MTVQANPFSGPLAAAEPPAPLRKRSYLRRHPAVAIGGSLLVLMILVALFAPWLWTVDPTAISTARRTRMPSELYWFGTDMLGRDIYSRVTYGARVSLTVDAILRRDYPVIQGVVLMFSLVYVLVNLIIDLTYTLVDPRIRY